MKYERINLTPGLCRDLKQKKNKLYYVCDKNCPGLWLWVYPSGFKTWYYHYRPKGRLTTNIKLGRFEMLNPTLVQRMPSTLIRNNVFMKI